MKSHKLGKLETAKFQKRREEYHRNLDLILEMGYETEDYIHHFPCFAGTLTLNRYLTLYELYKQTIGLAGHLCEIGTYKGSSTLLLGKLIQMYEPDSLTMMHSFDWFKGTKAVPENPLQVEGGNLEDEKRVRRLIELQGLENTIKIHNLDVEKELVTFFEDNPHLQFKLVFLDSGTHEVTSEAIRLLWPRLNIGGIMIFDQWNNEVAPGETRAVNEWLSDIKIETIPNSWMPSAFARKV
jgi:hypothetical protein